MLDTKFFIPSLNAQISAFGFAAVVLRSDSGGQHICDALTIIETARMQHKNVYDVVASSFS